MNEYDTSDLCLMKETPKKTSRKKQPKPADGKANPSPQDSVGDAPEDLSAEEMAVFQKIMGEIEDPDPDTLTTDSGNGDDELSDEEQAELSEVLESLSVEDSKAPDSEDGTDDEDLDADQQKAFDSIMAQIEGSDSEAEKSEPSEEPTEPAERAEPVESTDDDFAAELEKVARATETDTGADADSEDGTDDEDLDTDQQKAFDSIMAQIEGSDSDAEKSEPSEEPAEPVEPAESTDDDFAAELEKIARETETDTGADADSEDGTADEDLDTDQQKAFDSIMAQIEDDGQSDTEALQEPEAADTAANESDEVSVSTVNTTAAAETGSDTKTEETVKADPAEEKTVSVDPVIPDDEKTEIPVDAPAGTKIVDSNSAETASGEPSGSRTRPNRSKASSPKRMMIGAVLMFACVLVGGYFLWPVRKVDPPMAAVPAGDESPLVPAATTARHDGPPLSGETAISVAVTGSAEVSRLKSIAEDLDRLRDALISKQGEIQELRDYYQTGITSEINTILDVIRQSGKRTMGLKTAMADTHISLGLSAIQRRNAYIRRLRVPVQTLEKDIETLLYLKRKSEMLALMAARTSDIDVDGFVKTAEDAMRVRRQRLEQLNIDDVEVIPLPMETVWQDIASHLPIKPDSSPSGEKTTAAGNEAIWKAICEGDYSDKDRLTALSTKAARCLANWKGKDLFLNGLTDITPEAARELSHWEGEWLGLNSLKELSPEAAVYLARWKGRGLSLNGLTHLSPQVVAILSEWPGEQIELINVKYVAHWENPNIRLYFNESLQRKLDQTRK